MFRKLNRSCVASIDGNLAHQSKSVGNPKPKILRKLNRDIIIKDTNYNSSQQHDIPKQQKKWKTKQKSSLLQNEIPRPPKINRTFPGISSVTKKTAIVSPIRRTTVADNTRFQDITIVGERLQRFSTSSFSPVLSSASTLSVVSSSTSVLSPPKSKPIKLKRNFTSMTSNVLLQSPSPKTPTPEPSLMKKIINLDSKRMSGKLGTSSIPSKTSHGPTIVQKAAQNSSTLSALECKKKRQQKLQAYHNEKNPKFVGGNVVNKRTSVNESKTNSNFQISTPSLTQSSPVNKYVTSHERTRNISPVTPPTSISCAQLNRNQNTRPSVQTDESSRSLQNGKTSLLRSSKVVQLIPSPAQAASDEKRHLVKNAGQNKFSLIGPNPRFLTAKLNLKKISHLASASPKLHSEPSLNRSNDRSSLTDSTHSSFNRSYSGPYPSFNKSLNDRSSLTNSTHSSFNRSCSDSYPSQSLNDRSSLTNSTRPSLKRSLGDKSSSDPYPSFNKSLNDKSSLANSTHSLFNRSRSDSYPSQSLNDRSTLTNSTRPSLKRSLGDKSSSNKSCSSPNKSLGGSSNLNNSLPNKLLGGRSNLNSSTYSSLNKSLGGRSNLNNSLPNKLLGRRSNLNNSTYSSLNKSLGDRSDLNNSLPNKLLGGRSNLNNSTYTSLNKSLGGRSNLNNSLPNKLLDGRSNLNNSTYSSLNKSLGDRASCNASAYSPTKGNSERRPSFNRIPSNKPNLNKHLHTQLQRRNSTLSDTPNHDANSLESRKKNFEPRSGNFEINRSNTIQQSDGSSTVSSPSSNVNGADFQTEVNDVEMEDVSMNVPSLTALSSCIETENLPDSKHYVFVVDTNVLMHHLNFIDELKDTPLAGCGPPHIFIPWIVVNELDGLKAKDSKNRVEAMKAIRFVFSMLSSKHPRFHGQKAKLAKDIESSFGHENDDTILKFCTVLLEKTSKEKFGLISNDINLCNKAIINDINAYTPDTLFSKIKPDVEIYQDKSDSSTSMDKESEGMVVDTPSKPIKPCLQVDPIMCEAKLILKEILEPFLQESMKQAFGDMSKTFLKPAPMCLLEILGYYDKYWISVFGIIFKKSAKKFFDSIRNLLTSKKGFFSDLDDAFAAVIAIEKICKAIANEKPSVRGQVRRISKLTDDCKALTKLEEEEKVPVVNKNQNEIAFGIFNHLWGLINHLCGMTMDFAELPHEYKYVKPAEMPSMQEFQMLISNLFPALHKIKQGMSKVIDITTATEQDEHEQDYKRLYDYLLQFVPSLQIQASPPPAERFTVQCLKDFMLNQDNRDTVRNGFMQLIEYQKQLVQVIHLPIWK